MRYKTVVTIIIAVSLLSGCQQPERTDSVPQPRVESPQPAPAAQDTPPQRESQDPYIESSTKPTPPTVPDDQKASLLYEAKVDLLRVLICAEESVVIDGTSERTSEMVQAAMEHFSNLGFRVLDNQPCMPYYSSAFHLASMAAQRDIDLYILMQGKSKQVDKFGDFYSYEVDGKAKAAQISDKELLTTTSALIRGKRAMNAQQAGLSALQACGQQLATNVSDEIVRKMGRGLLLRRIRIDNVDRSETVDYIRVGLSKKPGIRAVDLKSWDREKKTAIFWVRMDASARENLAVYLEQLDNVKIKVDDLEAVGAEAHKKGLLEF